MRKRLALISILLACCLTSARVLLAAEELAPAATAAHEVPAAASHESAEPKAALVPDPTELQPWLQAGFVLILFVIILLVLTPTAWRPALVGLLNREHHIRTNRAGASHTRSQADATLMAYEAKIAEVEARIRQMLAKAQTDGEQEATALRMQAQREAEDAKDRAQREIDQSKTDALANIREQVAVLATSIASKVLRRELDVSQQQDSVPQKLEA